MSDYRVYDRYREDDHQTRRGYSPPDDRDYSPPRRSKSTRTYPRDRGGPDFVEETTYVERGKGPPPRDLIPRREDSVEDIPRDFPPPARTIRGYRDDFDDRRSTHRTRSEYGGRRGDYDDDDEDYDDRKSVSGRSRRGPSRRHSRRDDDYYSEDEEYERRDKYSKRGGRSRSRSRSPGEKRKSGIEGMLEGLGLGGVAGLAAKHLGGEKKGSRSPSRSRSGKSRAGSRSRSGSRDRDKAGKKQRQWAQAAQAALVAGAVEAFRARNDPGGWKGTKGRRVATAALGSGAIDRLVDRDPDEKSKRHLAEAVIGGLAANRLANGPRDKSADGRGRSRSRSRSASRPGGFRARSRSVIDRIRGKSRGRSVSPEEGGRAQSRGRGIKDLVAGGAVAAAGKAIYDRVRSKSRARKEDNERSRSRARSRSSSEDSYVPSRRRARDRSVGPQSQSARGLGPDDGAVVARGQRGAGPDEVGPLRGTRTGAGLDDKSRSSESSSESSEELENQRKKMRGKELLTAGLASIATIHAAHGVYQSMKGSENRHKLVQEGEMSPEEARKKRSKAWLQDAAAVGIAALGIKGAYSEWKEMNEQRHSVKELEERRAQRQKRNQERRERLKREFEGGRSRSRGPPPGRLPPPDRYDSPRRDGYPEEPYASGGLPPPPMGNGGYR